ncbi:MAG: hypothetical protein LAO56_00810 [Acidobacteriia bacterium]|nr:hypothetical protein [Terriglobia bacterium]
MNTNKVLYWVVLGVFALGLHSEYHNGRFPAIHRLADHAESTVCRLVSRAERTVALARVLTTPQPFAVDDLLASARDRELAQAELVREQVRAQADLVRAQAELQRSQIEQIRWRRRAQFKLTTAASRRITLVCPKTGARISVDAGLPDVQVGDNF